MATLIEVDKAFDKTPASFHDKKNYELGTETFSSTKKALRK